MTADLPGTTDTPVEAGRVPDDAGLDLLRSWLPERRWFPAKGSDAKVERLGVLELPDPAGEARVQVHLLALPSGAVLQVPTVLHPGMSTDGAAAGVLDGVIGPVGGGTLVDGPHDPAFVRAWLAAATHDVQVTEDLTDLHVTSGEQSNTSVLLPSTGPPAILKVFRAVTLGANPDVEVPLALSRAGWPGVPRPLAWLTGTWTGRGGERLSGHLGVLSELVVGAHDGFRLACELGGRGEDFGDLAEDLGRTTAQMHRALRTALPTHAERRPRTATARAAEVHHVSRVLRERALAAVAGAPLLSGRLAAVEAVYATLGRLDAVPPLQRVHGDYHLGQVLRSAGGRWYVIDFEGEPQAAASEKTRPDLALRDVAGMLRSFDYAAAVGGASSAWVRSAREHLVAGYHAECGDEAGDPAVDVLLRVLELDKALYEVVYESGNRPDWVHIPLDGVDRLLV
jgi:maltokinase